MFVLFILGVFADAKRCNCLDVLRDAWQFIAERFTRDLTRNTDPNLYLYRIVGEAKHTETAETLVVYQALYGNFQMYVRPISMFLSPVDRVKYPQAKQAFRFERCKYENGMWSPVSRG